VGTIIITTETTTGAAQFAPATVATTMVVTTTEAAQFVPAMVATTMVVTTTVAAQFVPATVATMAKVTLDQTPTDLVPKWVVV